MKFYVQKKSEGGKVAYEEAPDSMVLVAAISILHRTGLADTAADLEIALIHRAIGVAIEGLHQKPEEAAQKPAGSRRRPLPTPEGGGKADTRQSLCKEPGCVLPTGHLGEHYAGSGT